MDRKVEREMDRQAMDREMDRHVGRKGNGQMMDRQMSGQTSGQIDDSDTCPQWPKMPISSTGFLETYTGLLST